MATKNIYGTTAYITPSYYKTTLRPEIDLLVAVLVRAIQDASRGTAPIDRQKVCYPEVTTITTQEHIDAVRWLESDEYKPYSYLWVCHHLELCPERVRKFSRKYFILPDTQSCQP